MSLIEEQLSEIELCTSTVADLHFISPGSFTNAIVGTHDITALIRDTEAHERALFSVTSQADLLHSSKNGPPGGVNGSKYGGGRSGEAQRAPKRTTAVAAILGGDVAARLRRERAGDGQSRQAAIASSADADVELLLRGAEKLCTVYPMPGAFEKITSLRSRYRKAKLSADRYEKLVAEQASQLQQLKRPSGQALDYDNDEQLKDSKQPSVPLSEEDLRREEEEVRELENKKRALEERVRGMEVDLGGLSR